MSEVAWNGGKVVEGIGVNDAQDRALRKYDGLSG